MPLSEHEQRMLDEIENALYAEDPKFASSVRKKQAARPGSRRRWQAALLFVIGLVLLVVGLMVDISIGDFKIVSLIGFLLMFGAGVLALIGPRSSKAVGASPKSGKGGTKASKGSSNSGSRSSGSLSARMEERFNKRFDQDR